MQKRYFSKLLACSIICFILGGNCVASAAEGLRKSSNTMTKMRTTDLKSQVMHGHDHGERGPPGPPGPQGPEGPAFGNYAYALNDGDSTSALTETALTFTSPVTAGDVSYSDGIFTLGNPSCFLPAVYLVNVGYSSYDSECDNGSFTIDVSINEGGLTSYGNTVYAVNSSVGGGGSTAIVIVPPSGSAQLILALDGQFCSGLVSISIAQIDNHGTNN